MIKCSRCLVLCGVVLDFGVQHCGDLSSALLGAVVFLNLLAAAMLAFWAPPAAFCVFATTGTLLSWGPYNTFGSGGLVQKTAARESKETSDIYYSLQGFGILQLGESNPGDSHVEPCAVCASSNHREWQNL